MNIIRYVKQWISFLNGDGWCKSCRGTGEQKAVSTEDEWKDTYRKCPHCGGDGWA